MAAMSSAIILVGLTLFAFQTKYDFTSWLGALSMVGLGFLVFALVAMVFPGKIMTAVCCGVGALIFACYLIVDTQLLLGRGTIKLEDEDVIIGALMLYIDIVNIFLMLLRFLTEMSSN